MSDYVAGDDLPHGWVMIGKRQWFTSWIGVSSLFAVILFTSGFNLAINVGPSLGVPRYVAVLGMVGILVLVFVVTTLILNRRWPQPAVNLDTSELRSGKRIVSLASFDGAVLTALPLRKRNRVVVLKILAGKTARADFVLRDRKGRAPSSETAQVLAEALRRTSIAMPVSKDDPTGRFARYNFPTNITRDEAVGLAKNPPTRDQVLPISS